MNAQGNPSGGGAQRATVVAAIIGATATVLAAVVGLLAGKTQGETAAAEKNAPTVTVTRSVVPPSDARSSKTTEADNPESLAISGAYRQLYKEKSILLTPSKCSFESDGYIDLDEPRINPGEGSDIQYTAECEDRPPRLLFSVNFSVPASASTAEDCAESIKLSASKDVKLLPKKGQIICVETDGADREGQTYSSANIALVKVARVTSDKSIAGTVQAWRYGE